MKYLSYHKEDGVAVVTLNNEARYNAVNMDLLKEMEKVQYSIIADSAVRVVVIKGKGKHFCAGMDLQFLNSADHLLILEKLPWLQDVYSRWQEMTVPVIAAVQGSCIGSGVELILGCDFRIAAENARFSLPEVMLGLSPDMGGTTRLTKLVGAGQAKRIIIGGEEIKAAEALQIGLVEIMVKPEELDSRTMSLARKIAAYPPLSVRWAKQGINLAAENNARAGLLFEQAQSVVCFASEDLKEAMAAYIEKRPADFKGR